MKIETFVSIASCLVSALSIGAALSCAYNASRIEKMTGASMQDISRMSKVNISQHVVDEAVTQSVEAAADAAAQKVMHNIEADMKNRVKGAVMAELSDVKKRVGMQVAETVSAIDPEQVAKDAAFLAAKTVSKKLESRVDSLIKASASEANQPIVIKF